MSHKSEFKASTFLLPHPNGNQRIKGALPHGGPTDSLFLFTFLFGKENWNDSVLFMGPTHGPHLGLCHGMGPTGGDWVFGSCALGEGQPPSGDIPSSPLLMVPPSPLLSFVHLSKCCIWWVLHWGCYSHMLHFFVYPNWEGYIDTLILLFNLIILFPKHLCLMH